jgi:hypothetical protein
MEMSFPPRGRLDVTPERSKDFDRLVEAVRSQQKAWKEASESNSLYVGTCISGDAVIDRISFFSSRHPTGSRSVVGSFLPQESIVSTKVNRIKADVYLAALTNSKSTDLSLGSPEQPVALRGMEN